ncbi:survival motor neuron interacting protein 1-domain-containing protein [Phycomyces nitens]|nr:survival motor neuron interacting protein 1-domain-containing protein [Phycomyces nitens]
MRQSFQIQQEEDELNDNGRQAIPISKSRMAPVNGIPANGEDYLLHVRQQASRCAQTVVAPPPKYTRQISLPSHYQFAFDTTAIPTHLLPSKEWQESFGRSFKSFQQEKQGSKPAQKAPPIPMSNKNEWHSFCYKDVFSASQLDCVAHMSQRLILRLLSYFKEWITDMTEQESLWIFTLLVYLDPVMCADSISLLRSFSRRSIEIRNSKTEQDDSLVRLNTIITIISKAFGQADLV